MDQLGPDVPVHFTAFHPDYRMLDTASTPRDSLITARRIALEHGLRYVYTGNIHDKRTGSTYCHACGHCLIGRDWYELSDWTLTEDGACGNCGTPCAGVFEARPGTWGSKRQPIRLKDYADRRVGASRALFSP